MAEDNEPHLEGSNVSKAAALLSEVDVETRIYEGGLKSWECSVDLVSRIATAEEEFMNPSLVDQSVDITEVWKRSSSRFGGSTGYWG